MLEFPPERRATRFAKSDAPWYDVLQKGEQRVTVDIAQMLVILAIAIILFITEWLRVDVVALLVLLSLVITGLISPEEAFSGFSSPAVLTVWAVFIVSGGLFHTGVANLLGDRLLKIGTRVHASVRRIVLHLPTSFPYAHAWGTVARSLGAAGG